MISSKGETEEEEEESSSSSSSFNQKANNEDIENIEGRVGGGTFLKDHVREDHGPEKPRPDRQRIP